MSVVTHNMGHFVLETRPRDLLLDWVNLNNAPFLARNPEVNRSVAHQLFPTTRRGKVPGFVPDTPEQHNRRIEDWLNEVRRCLRLAWKTEDRRDREFYLFSARWQYEQGRLSIIFGDWGRHLIPVASQDSFHQAIFDLVDSGAVHKLSICAYKDCRVSPYFIRRRQKRQPYCSTVCHAEALREIKRRWHRENRGKTAQNRGTA
jgi:hypothetical protein